MKAKHIQNLSPAMPARSAQQKERGIALLLTIFGLLLLTALATAMLFSSNSETTIAANYRDKNSSSYGAFSGLQEARERLQPVSGDMGTLLTATPTTSNNQVLYIINPSAGETVAPWDPTNPYFDTELCQENILGVTGTHGVSCSTSAIPAGTGWYTVYDNSANATAWKLGAPLNYKWVRVTLKQNQNTPSQVDPTSASNLQVCWDGLYQDIIPTGYTSSCNSPTGNMVIGLNVTSPGSGYTSAPTITITGGGGSGASADATIAAAPTDAISGVTLTNGGSGYTAVPNVTIATGNATFQAIVASSAVTSVTMSSPTTNYCYSSGTTPTVNFSTSPVTETLSNASATANMNTSAGCIALIGPGGKCSNTTAGVSYPFSSVSGGGSGFAGSVTFQSGNHRVKSYTVTQVGSGYTSGSATFDIVDDSGSTCALSGNITTGAQVSSISVTSGGAYMAQPAVSLGGVPASPSGAVLPTLTAQPNPWPANASAIIGINVTSGGSGYTPGVNYPLIITPSNGLGVGGAAYATASGAYVLSGFTNLVGGNGYTTPPTVTISGGGGIGATATATIGSGGIVTSMGRVYLLTSMAVTRSGAKSMAQMEVGVRPPFNLNLPGAITLAGPEPPTACLPFGTNNPLNTCTFPNSSNFTVNGTDANSCGGGAAPNKPAVGVYDNQSQTDVINAINPNRYTNYVGVDGSTSPPVPSVEQVYAALGGARLTPTALNDFIQDIWNTPGTTQLTGSISSLPTTTTSSVTVVNGDLSLSGNPRGSGILVVTGTMTFSGDFNWNGLVLVAGKGVIVHNGGGNMFIDGSIYVAQTLDPSANPPGSVLTNQGLLPQMGTPSFTWNGGGTSDVQYDHCLADSLLKKYENQPSPNPLQILSSRTLQF